MIKITSFYPFQSLLKVTHEFHEDKAFVKMKSITYEREFEFEYKDVGEISDAFCAKIEQVDFGYYLLLFTAITLCFFRSFIYANPILLRVEQILFLSGLILCVSGFNNRWRIIISDRNNNILTHMERTRQNRELIAEVIEKIKNISENVEEISAARPFPDENSLFEHTYYDISKVSKTTDRFYECEVIGFQKDMYGEIVYSIKYSHLTGKVFRGKSSSNLWCRVLYPIMFLISIIVGLIFAFDVNFGTGLKYLLGFPVALVLISIPLSFIKREMIGLYDKTGNILYWTYVNRKNKEYVEEIIKFIQSKIPQITQDQLLKEQT